jgi:hypothetical protein
MLGPTKQAAVCHAKSNMLTIPADAEHQLSDHFTNGSVL